jgi:hypothetical protein
MAENYLHYGDNPGILRRYVKDGSQIKPAFSMAFFEAGLSAAHEQIGFQPAS